MRYFKKLFLTALACCIGSTAMAQSGKYELLDQGEAFKMFSAPIGSKVKVIRNGKPDIIIKQSISVQEQSPQRLFGDITLVRRLPGFISRDVRFQFGSDKLTPSAKHYLDTLAPEIARSFRANQNLTLLIAGFTDAVGSAAYNLDLSARRATAVKLYLMRRSGLPSCLFNTASFGEAWEGLLVKTKQANALNRRVEIRSTDVLTSATSGLAIFSCSTNAQVGSATIDNTIIATHTPAPIVTKPGIYCNANTIGTSVTLSFKGFKSSEFTSHFANLWPTLTGYKSHRIEEIQPNVRRYHLDLTAGSCEILDDILRHLGKNGYQVDKQIVTQMQGRVIVVEKL